MIVGVVFFTFVVSNINSIISQKNKKDLIQEKNMLYLERANREYKFSNSIMCMAMSSVKKNQGIVQLENIEDLLRVFPKNLKKQLQMSVYEKKVSKINFFNGLHPDILIALGQCLYKVMYTKRNINYEFK